MTIGKALSIKVGPKFLSICVIFLMTTLQALAQTNPSEVKPASPRPEDLSTEFLFHMAVEGGGGWNTKPATEPAAYAGAKFGAAILTLDLGYDRVHSHSGGSAELSALIPVFRFPGPQKDEKKNYLRFYVEPGLGYRTGASLNGYASAKGMFVLFSDYRIRSAGVHWSPLIEVQHRFPFNTSQQGDTRIAIGLITTVFIEEI